MSSVFIARNLLFVVTSKKWLPPAPNSHQRPPRPAAIFPVKIDAAVRLHCDPEFYVLSVRQPDLSSKRALLAVGHQKTIVVFSNTFGRIHLPGLYLSSDLWQVSVNGAKSTIDS